MDRTISLCIGMAFACWSGSALAEGKYRVTDVERAACEGDAIDLCSSAYPNEDALLACMKLNIPSLTAGCRPVFLEGLPRRGLR